MTRSPVLLLGLLAALLASPARADCNWVRDVTSWDAAIGWSWYSLKYTWDEPTGGGGTITNEAITQDAGSASGSLPNGFSGVGGVRLAEGPLTGSLRFLDRLDITPIPGTPDFIQYAANGPVTGFSVPLPVIHLYLDTNACTYHWDFQASAAGTLTTNSGSTPLPALDVNSIQSGPWPIPDVAGPLDFDGAIHASTIAPPDEITPWFVSFGEASGDAATNSYAPRTSFPDASVRWHFGPGGTVAPPNDTCTGAGFLLGAASEDVSFATNAATDPASACGTGDRSVWFFIVPDETGTASISTSGSGYSTVVSVWQAGPTCAGLTTEVACGANGASVPVQAGVPLLVQVQRAGGAGNGVLQIELPEPDAAAEFGVACAWLGRLARRRRSPTRSA